MLIRVKYKSSLLYDDQVFLIWLFMLLILFSPSFDEIWLAAFSDFKNPEWLNIKL